MSWISKEKNAMRTVFRILQCDAFHTAHNKRDGPSWVTCLTKFLSGRIPEKTQFVLLALQKFFSWLGLNWCFWGFMKSDFWASMREGRHKLVKWIALTHMHIFLRWIARLARTRKIIINMRWDFSYRNKLKMLPGNLEQITIDFLKKYIR